MDFTILLLATSFAEAWSKWFFIGIAIGVPLIIVAAVITYFQMRNNSEQNDSENALEQQDKELDNTL